MKTYLVKFTIGDNPKHFMEEVEAASGSAAAEMLRRKNNRYLAGFDVLAIYEQTFRSDIWPA